MSLRTEMDQAPVRRGLRLPILGEVAFPPMTPRISRGKARGRGQGGRHMGRELDLAKQRKITRRVFGPATTYIHLLL